MRKPELLLAARCCGQCLTTRHRIVSGERAAEIIECCRREQRHFECHKGSIAGLIVHCRGVHEILIRRERGSLAFQMAERLGIPIREVDSDKLEEAGG